MTSAARREKSHKLLKNNDPRIDVDNYRSSILVALNYLNVTYDGKTRRQWIKNRFPQVNFRETSGVDLQVLSNLVRLTDNGNELSDKHTKLLNSEVVRLTATAAPAVKETKAPTNKVSIQDKMDEKAFAFLGEFAGLVDEFTVSGQLPKVSSLITTMGIRGPMIKRVVDAVTPTITELNNVLAGKDSQLVEGYSQFSRPELKKLLGIYNSLLDALGQVKVLTPRKVRAVKVKAPAVITKGVKFQVENKDLKIKSIAPAAVIGCTELWVFNTKYRKLMMFEAAQGSTLTFQGSTLMNFDVAKSTSKTVRKAEQLAALVGKREFAKNFKELASKTSPVGARFTADCLILKAF